MTKVIIIDYGMGNLASVNSAVRFIGADPVITNDPESIAEADRIILPGVGAFAKGMENMKKLGIDRAVRHAVSAGKPFLGICLGLQFLFTESREYGSCAGLDILKGSVRKLEGDMIIPHIGWNTVKLNPGPGRMTGSAFEGIRDNSYFYFVHSYYVEPADPGVIAGLTGYGTEFTSAVRSGNICAVQFHPEKSGSAGLKILKNFCMAGGGCAE